MPVRGPLITAPLVTAPLVFFSILAAIALALSAWLFGGLAFTGMNDDYAIGVWKTFNVVTLTALGFDVGRPWNFYHVILRGTGTCTARCWKSRSA